MCGRFYLSFLPSAEDLFNQQFGMPVPEFEYPPILSDDMLPFRDITTIHPQNSDRIVCRPMFWNLIPGTSPKFESNKTWFNTRKEKLEDPYQKNLLRYKRCVVPMNGFLENKKINGKPVYHSQKIAGKTVRKKENYEFTLNDQPLMMLAGIYDIWNKNHSGARYSCSIITLEPNSLIGEVHDRMPFILADDVVRVWLDKSVDDSDFLIDLIRPFPSEKLTMKRKWPDNLSAQTDLFG